MVDPLKMITDLQKMPALLAEAFVSPLSLQEENLLKGLDEEMAVAVSSILEKALAGEPMMVISPSDQAKVREMNAIRRVIRDILSKKGMAGALLSTAN